MGYSGPDCSIKVPTTTAAPTDAPTPDNAIKMEKKETPYGKEMIFLKQFIFILIQRIFLISVFIFLLLLKNKNNNCKMTMVIVATEEEEEEKYCFYFIFKSIQEKESFIT